MADAGNSWVEQLYYYFVESVHYSPNLFGLKTDPENKLPYQQVLEKVRRYEVPLNGVLNISLRVFPTRIISGFLNCFLDTQKVDFCTSLTLRHYLVDIDRKVAFAQPDTTLEDENTRIFIEMKVGDNLELSQIWKYVMLLARWNLATEERRKPYLLLLTKKPIKAQWVTKERNIIFINNDGIDNLLTYLKNARIQRSPRMSKDEFYRLKKEAKWVCDNLTIGATTWTEIGQYFQTELDKLRGELQTEFSETGDKLISDLLQEFRNRKLLD
ncbi:MAG: hypothetical protein HXX08_03400 [Chloroflexi bacterium]|uniref:Uncharacterized protein n=1 Tax=Candidatus Chlorohelix allophototropha TaxID=3003348 RepID=A0A8T7LXG5_9CHLR|nr:hypothetical protein [Chloroflexota bacterium]WJW66783.1 hypothetical protein OZ401_000028 [Chloroflexota bacterium L227-S17]